MPSYHDITYRSTDGLNLYARDYPHPEPRAVVLCMHGLTRNSADFGRVCEDLNDDYRLIAVDQRGRGRSDYDPEPANYNPQTYVRDMLGLLDHLGLERVIAIGTSMGGVISMALAATAADRLAAVVLNDIGPEIDSTGLDRIRGYVGKLAPVDSWDAAAAQVRSANAIAFPDYGEDDWLAFARNVYVEDASGRPVPAYDEAIAASISTDNTSVDLWPLFDALRDMPVLVVRGATSDILAPACVERMQARHPDLGTVEVPQRGHAPMLDEAEAATAVRRFLERVA
ncbi:MAG: alpha/beta fold hydrolase [Gammaproteobacteria bacterium]